MFKNYSHILKTPVLIENLIYNSKTLKSNKYTLPKLGSLYNSINYFLLKQKPIFIKTTQRLFLLHQIHIY